MPDPAFAYNELIRTMLWPAFKKLGYRKSGNNFRYYHADGWGKIVQFQKSRYSAATALSFTVNVGLYLLDYAHYAWGETAGPRFQEPACVVRKRLGSLTSGVVADWFELTDKADQEVLCEQVQTAFARYIRPYLAAITGPDAIYALLLAGHRADFPAAQIHLLYQAGHQAAALQLFSSEFAQSKSNPHYRTTLRHLAADLHLPATGGPVFGNL